MTDLEKRLIGLYALIVLACVGWHVWKPWERVEKPPAMPSPAQLAWAEIGDNPPPLRCNATWYSAPEHGRKTASGEIFDSTALTCAIYSGFLRIAPYGSTLLVRNTLNRRCVLVRVTDNMPSWYARTGKMLDLSRAAAESLDMVTAGVVPVEAWMVK